MVGPQLNLYWEGREPAQADDARRLSDFVSGLPDFDPIYRSWLSSPTTKKETVPVPLSEAEAKRVLADKITRYDVDDAPWPELGSEIRGGHAGPPPYDFRDSSYADTRCRIGAYRSQSSINPNHVFMRLSALRPSTGRPWRASELRPLMKFARETWAPAEMCATFPFFDFQGCAGGQLVEMRGDDAPRPLHRNLHHEGAGGQHGGSGRIGP